MESQCDITAVLLKNQMLEGIEDACRKYEKLESENSFFIPLVPTDFEKGQLVFSKGKMICEKCKENYAVNQRIAYELLDEIEEYMAKSKAGSNNSSDGGSSSRSYGVYPPEQGV
jgi:hypothetical protein